MDKRERLALVIVGLERRLEWLVEQGTIVMLRPAVETAG